MMDAVRKIDGLMKGHGSSEWISKLAETMNANGFEDANLFRVKPDQLWSNFSTDCYTLAFAEIASRLPQEGDDQKREFERLVADVGEETKRGAVQGVAKIICVARKSRRSLDI